MYTNFAEIYDKLMHDVNYSLWADYVEDIFMRYGRQPELVLDLGCGTGSFSVEMASRGYDMIGVDISPEMLCCAREKSEKKQLNILFLHQDMTRFELYGTVDVIVCLMDSVNYITGKTDLKRMFSLVRNYLNPDGLFIFDVNSLYKFEQVFDHNVFYEVEDEVTFLWQNTFEKRKKICTFDLTFFVKQGEEYTRYDETHFERAYSDEEIRGIIEKSGLKLDRTYEALKFTKPRVKSERVFYVCRKIGS